MAKLNTSAAQIHTHEGAPAKHINAEAELRRSVMACMLWENQFYESGEDIAARILRGVEAVSGDFAAKLAIEARSQMNLRHAPLLLASAICKVHGGKAGEDAVYGAIQRADELAEIVAIHCRVNGTSTGNAKKVLGAPMKRGLARAFRKFDEYALAKYNRQGAVKLRDVLFMCHAKPESKDQEALWKRLIDGNLSAPDTWEVGLSGGGDKKETFERLLREGNLGYLALLRNLRGMAESGVDTQLVKDAILARKGAHRVLPFRFVAAARYAPQFERELDYALVQNIEAETAFPGKTAVLIDVSGSMHDKLSQRSDMTRIDAAATLGAVIPGDVRVFTFSADVVEVPPRKGMAGVDAIIQSQRHSTTYLGQAVKAIDAQVPYDRLIVITDEQSHDRVPDPKGRGYMINVASYQNGVGYGAWTHIDGFSEAVIRYIRESEAV